MNHTHISRCCTLTGARLFAFAFLLLTATAIVPAQNKMTAEEIVAKHLAAIGTDKARQGVTSRIALGTCTAIFRGQRDGRLSGRAVVASQDTRSLIGISFDSPEYPHEKAGYDGNKFRVGYITPGRRSALGTFLLNNEGIYKEGLVGGTLSSAWSLLDVAKSGAKLEYAGTDKIDNRAVHKIRYLPKRAIDLGITLYFDAETFRHVRTVYERTVAPGLATGGGDTFGGRRGARSGNVDASAGQRETRFRLTENFSDFKKEGGLMLPHTYEIGLVVDATGGTITHEYRLTLDQFSFNQDLAVEFFNAEAS